MGTRCEVAFWWLDNVYTNPVVGHIVVRRKVVPIMKISLARLKIKNTNTDNGTFKSAYCTLCYFEVHGVN